MPEKAEQPSFQLVRVNNMTPTIIPVHPEQATMLQSADAVLAHTNGISMVAHMWVSGPALSGVCGVKHHRGVGGCNCAHLLGCLLQCTSAQ